MLALLMCLIVCSIPQAKTPVKKVPAHLGTSLHSMTQTTTMRDRPAEPPAIGENESPPIHHLRIKVRQPRSATVIFCCCKSTGALEHETQDSNES
jgi:hypothetical protein